MDNQSGELTHGVSFNKDISLWKFPQRNSSWNHVWNISMLLTRWWESHWDRRQRTSRTTLTQRFLSASNQAWSSAPLQCFMESHGSDPAPHALSLFMLIRSVVLCLSTECSRDSFLFPFFPFFVAARIVQLSTLSSHRTGPNSITSDFTLRLLYYPSPIIAWAPEQGTETRVLGSLPTL